MFRAGMKNLTRRWNSGPGGLNRARAAGCSRAYNHFWPGADERDLRKTLSGIVTAFRGFYHYEENGFQYGLEFMGSKNRVQ